MRHQLAIFGIFILLMLSFVLVWRLERTRMSYVKNYLDVDCEAIKSLYWKDADDEEIKLKMAFKEYKIYNDKDNLGSPMVGNLVCFCKE